MNNSGVIYLLESNECYKIGVTKNQSQISKRIKQLNTGNSNKIILVNFFECEKYFKVEKALHRKYAFQKTETNNEWFNLTPEQVSSFTADCESFCDNLTFIFNNNIFLK